MFHNLSSKRLMFHNHNQISDLISHSLGVEVSNISWRNEKQRVEERKTGKKRGVISMIFRFGPFLNLDWI